MHMAVKPANEASHQAFRSDFKLIQVLEAVVGSFDIIQEDLVDLKPLRSIDTLREVQQ